ncbi:hypothetical protein SDC9_67705 [bioreactor metagenome]|uniref:Uncharacterized protein n=1 Tax=bioreactor metagenome TaxID=1076179 RepID=A0A644Y033_9ZZZZ
MTNISAPSSAKAVGAVMYDAPLAQSSTIFSPLKSASMVSLRKSTYV